MAGHSCPPGKHPCSLEWQQPEKYLKLYRDPAAPGFGELQLLAGPFQSGKGSAVELVEIEGGQGLLECEGATAAEHGLEERAITPETTMRWTATAPPELKVDAVEISGHTLRLSVANTRAPELIEPAAARATTHAASDTTNVMATGALVGALLVALALLWLIRKRRGQPTGQKAGSPARANALTRKRRDDLVTHVLACKSTADLDGRKCIIEHLPKALQSKIAESSRADMHVTNMVTACERHPGGIEALRDAIAYWEHGSTDLQALDEFLAGDAAADDADADDADAGR